MPFDQTNGRGIDFQRNEGMRPQTSERDLIPARVGLRMSDCMIDHRIVKNHAKRIVPLLCRHLWPHGIQGRGNNAHLIDELVRKFLICGVIPSENRR